MKQYIYKAIEIDENLSEAYDLLGLYNACFEWKWNEAQLAWQHSVGLSPNNVMALLSYSINRSSWREFDFARKLVARAQEIDPLWDYGEISAALPDFCTTKYDKVVNRFSKYLELDPPFWWGLWYLWRTLSIMNRKDEAVEACKKSFISIGLNDIIQAMDKAVVYNAFETAARSMADIYKFHYTSPYDIALLFSHAGKQEEALNWLEKSIEDIDLKLHFIDVDPEWQSIRSDERFIKCLKTIGFIT